MKCAARDGALQCSTRVRAVWLALALAAAAGRGGAQEGAAGADDETVRPFDLVVLKKGGSMLGTIETLGDYRNAPEVVFVASSGGTRIKLSPDDIASVVPRQSADQVYKLRLKRVEGVTDSRTRAQQELDLGLWCKTPLAALGGAPPRPADAFRHMLAAVDRDPTLAAAYPHLIAALAEEDRGAGAAGDFDRDAHVHLLAAGAGRSEPELDYRLGVYLAEQAGQPSHAQVLLERFLASDHRNQSQRRHARRLLKDIYLERGAVDPAKALYEKSLVDPEASPANFEGHFELGRILARHGGVEGERAARERFAKALAIEPGHLEALAEVASLDYRSGALPAAEKGLRGILAKDPGNTAVSISLGLTLIRSGKLAAAEALLKPLAESSEPFDRARAIFGLGQIADGRGQDLVALNHFREAGAIDPDLLEARVAHAMALLRAGNVEDARGIAQAIVQADRESPAVFAAASRVLGEAAWAENSPDAALSHLLRAVQVSAADAALLERVGILLLRAGKLDLGFAHLLRARQAGGDRPDTLNAMAYYHYARGDHDAARKLFAAVLATVKAPPRPTARDARPIPVPPARVYALRGQELIEDLGRLEMWVADLPAAESSTLNGWQEVERFGIDITGRNGAVTFRGTQSGTADGVTMALLDRPVDAATFDRAQVTARIDAGKVRVGVRLEAATKAGSSIGLIFYRDFTGTLKAQVKGATGDWEAVPKTEEGSPDGGKLVNPELAVWPDGNAPHVLEVRRSHRPQSGAAAAGSRGLGVFDLYFDGEPVMWNVKVTGIGGKTYEVGVSGQTDALGNQYSIQFEGFKIYRELPRKRDKKEF